MIHPLRREDIPDWLPMRLALWPDTPLDHHERDMAEILSKPDTNAVFIARSDEAAPLGFIEVSLRPWAEGCYSSPVGYIEGWYVAEHVRGQGIGAQLVQAAEAWARAQGCTEMGSDAEVKNVGSAAAHQRLGYEIATRLVCFRKALTPPEEPAAE
jgi:aminoglycoside 6'-N-acetyltransferase I